ncbi:unnamed protein product, partial [Prorocentrum cordatum]
QWALGRQATIQTSKLPELVRMCEEAGVRHTLPTSFGKSQEDAEAAEEDEELQPDLEASASASEADAATTLSALESAVEALERVVNLSDAEIDWDQLSQTLAALAATAPAVAQILLRHGWIPPSGGFTSTPNLRQLLAEVSKAFDDLGGKRKEDKRRRKKDWKPLQQKPGDSRPPRSLTSPRQGPGDPPQRSPRPPPRVVDVRGAAGPGDPPQRSPRQPPRVVDMRGAEGSAPSAGSHPSANCALEDASLLGNPQEA